MISVTKLEAPTIVDFTIGVANSFNALMPIHCSYHINITYFYVPITVYGL